jgi:hypothetical protein
MMDKFTHQHYTFYRREGCWLIQGAWHISDMHREMAMLLSEGIPADAMQIVSLEPDRHGGYHYYRLQIDGSSDGQVIALAERLRQAWLAQKVQDDARWEQQKEAALAHQAAQGMNDPDFWNDWDI